MIEPVRLALLGDPVAHSRSPAIQRAALREAGIEGEYTAIRADVEMLQRALDQMRDGILTGINVTMPLKEPAFRFADELTPIARAAGSVNTVRCLSGSVEAHTTDAVAFREVLDDETLFEPDLPVLVLGSGGSARAALAALGERKVYISARSEGKAALLDREFGTAGFVSWGAGLAGALVVNATPLGMNGERLAEEILALAEGLIDLPYGAEETPAVRWASTAGLPVLDGIEFLARQARASFEWWTGETVDLESLIWAARNV